ncbi:hypothetical protein EOA29_09040 [Mesorhizobium sp. M1E.F.Ca.ET.063.01.1.1]|nr:hypothetical protein EOA29_09040 [Mesorhizobium sp. M1E.F.Ca.ET.063.01.1.1]
MSAASRRATAGQISTGIFRTWKRLQSHTSMSTNRVYRSLASVSAAEQTLFVSKRKLTDLLDRNPADERI